MRTVPVDTETGEILAPPEGEEMSRSTIVGLMATGWQYKQEKAQAGRAYATLMGTPDKPGPIRAYSDEHIDDVLYDGELNIELVRLVKSGAASLDVMTMAKDKPQVLLKLAELGLLTMAWAAWKAHPKNFIEADDAKGYVSQGGESVSLEIKKRGGR